MQQEGPMLESLTRRLAETPEDFLAEPRIGQRGRVHVAAVVNDLLRNLGIDARLEQLTAFMSRSNPPTEEVPDAAKGAGEAPQERNRLAVTLLLCWLLFDDWFKQAKPGLDQMVQLLAIDAAELANRVVPRKFVTDPDRREELARRALARLGFRPSGETLAQAQDRLATLDSTERARVLKAARAAEERARQIREALARKAAQESADKWTRE
jgi:hypothetical protein